MENEVEKWLMKNHPYLRSKVTDITTIVSLLYSKKLISTSDAELIKNAYVFTTTAERWDKISENLISRSNMLSMADLREIFEKSENYHIIYALGTESAQPSSSSGTSVVHVETPETDFRFRNFIRQNYEFLTSNLVNHNQVADQMFKENIILSSKSEKIKSSLSNIDKSDEILSCMLSGTSTVDYRKFLQILNETGNPACFQVLEDAGNVKISEKMLKFEKDEREAIRGDFRVQNHHCVSIALKLSEVPRLMDNWGLICEEILTPRAIANLENERNFETKIMRTIQAWVSRMGRDASYNLLINKIKPINNAASDELEKIREEISGFTI